MLYLHTAFQTLFSQLVSSCYLGLETLIPLDIGRETHGLFAELRFEYWMGDPVVEGCREGRVRRFQVVSESDAEHSIDRQMYLAVDGRLD